MKNSKSNAARSKLIMDSVKAKKTREEMVFKAENEKQALYYASLPINDYLLAKYKEESGAEVFKTFKQWKDEGYSVKKGEKAFRVWSAPIKSKKEVEATNFKTQETETIEKSFEFWGVCCLFNELQVEKTEGGSSATTNNVSPIKKPAQKVEKAAAAKTPATSAQTSKLAEKLQTIGEKLTTEIDKCFSDRPTNTPKRLAQANRARANGERLKRTQAAALALAKLHKKGNVPAVLANTKTKKAIYDLVAAKEEPVPNGYHTYYIDTGVQSADSEEADALWSLLNGKSPEEKAKEELQRKIDGLQFTKIEGYFPTQGEALETLIDHANIEDGHCIADTSAGSGHILDSICEHYNVDLEAYEINYTLREILEAKGYNVIGGDLLAASATSKYDRIVINPPFERLQDVDHVQHSFSFLKPGGRLVAIMSPSAFFRSDKKSKAFREWFSALGGIVEDMPDGSFKASGTMVSTKLIIIDRPEVEKEGEDNNPFVCKNYEAKQVAREQRCIDRANKAKRESNQAYDAARRMGDAIPLGQPILVGHHSEKGDRRYRKRMNRKYDNAVELSNKGDYYSEKAESIGKGGIASDDPEAIPKLKAKLFDCQQQQELMKKANKFIKKNDDKSLLELGLEQLEIDKLKEPDFVGRVGFAGYQLKNNNAEIRRLKQRIACLTELREQAPINHEHDEFKVFVDNGRIHFDFGNVKPPEKIRKKLNSNSYTFSRYSRSWVRKVTSNAISHCNYVIKDLELIYSDL